jgi:hypothetical protein
MGAIFEGVDDLIDVALGVRQVGTSVPHYRHRTAALVLRSKPTIFDVRTLLDAITNRLYQNWSAGQDRRPRRASSENWRWEKKLWISKDNRSVEKICEKLIAEKCGPDWVNQVPTASGLIDGTSERHCNIDLVHRVGKPEYEFIELKYADSTPLFAAFEILKYGLLYLFSRDFVNELGYSVDDKPVLAARTVHLRVVAPALYYIDYEMRWLEDEINAGIRSFGTGCIMDFRFESICWPDTTNVAEAVASRTAVYNRGEAQSV